MNSVLSSVRSLVQMFDGKTQEFISDIDNVHMVWLEEIQQEANRMFSRDFNAEPELMPKTPSQKKNSRRKRVSLGRQEDNQAKRRFSKGKRSNLRGSSVKSLNFIAEEESIPEASTSQDSTTTQPKRNTRKNKQTKPEVAEDVSHSPHSSCKTEEVQNKKPELVEEEEVDKNTKGNNAEVEPDDLPSTAPSPPKKPLPEVVVNISSSDRLSAEFAKKQEPSPGRTAAKIAIAGAAQSSRRSSVRCSLKLRHSLAGLRHSMTQESVRRASRRSMLKRKAVRTGNSTCSSNISVDSCMDSTEEEDKEVMPEAVTSDTEDNAAAEESQETPKINQSIHPSVGRITRSVAANSPTLAPPSLFIAEQKMSTPNKRTVVTEKQQTSQSSRRSSRSTKRKAPDTVEESPTKRFSPPKKSQSAIRPNMRSFLHTVQKNQMLMMTPNSLGRTAVIKSFIKHTTPMRGDSKSKERHKLEALKKKQEQEEERMKKMEEDKKRKQEELKRKRDERLRRVFEAKVKEEQREEEKKKKIEQKMAQIDEKNDKRQAEEKAKKKVAIKRQEELEQKKKLEEEAKRKKVQQAEEEKRQQEAKKKAEEEEQRARKQAETRKAQELKREQERERERELEKERQAAAERERVEKEKALALQRELERAAREKERRELEQKRKLEEQQRLAAEEKAAKEREAAKQREAAAKQAAKTQAAAGLNVTMDIENSVMSTPVGKGGGLNVTVDIEQSPQSYSITPKGGNKPLVMSKSAEDYGMDQNSDDSTDDESAPRKPIPSWAEGPNLQQIIMKQYFNPPDLDSFFGTIEPPKLENIFYKSKPRYFKRTSSAVWHSPPIGTK
ncbi:inner centromere protein isoform X4 [Seriola lalandi dorsalis]|uniref:inner centromere protein isoform X4 n=1 Tax=Seriola lalandi dorsalis TaxID=1841481 RepID=UPI000C6FADAF|nr:inner centromere protein isoform X4 [Seriola lalandi dorsalis]XP_056244285.1 inner centromere protein isoform X5 [Seriola aureovittata]